MGEGLGPYAAFGEWLRNKRVEAHLKSQPMAELRAKNLGLDVVNQGKLSYLERGWNENPEPELLSALAKLYRVPAEEVIARWMEVRFGVSTDRLAAVKEGREPRPTSVAGFTAVPLLARPIAAGQPLVIESDPERDDTIAFKDKFVHDFGRPICLRVGRREESMLPTVHPGDVVALDVRPATRERPKHGHVYAINFGPLSGDEGGAVKRVELAEGHLVVSSDNPDKGRYPTLVFDLAGKNLLEILRGEVVWFGRYVGSGKGR